MKINKITQSIIMPWLVLLCLSTSGASVNVFSPRQKLVAADGTAFDQFGGAVAISGNTALVGAPYEQIGANVHQGAVYVFVRAGTTWSQQARLEATDGQAQDFFGVSIAISGGTIVVGADSHDIGGNPDQGAAYVFGRSGNNWNFQQELSASDGSAGDQFGHSVGILRDTAVVGAWTDDFGAASDQGSAYLFTRNGSTWTEQQQLTTPGGSAADQFGVSVALGRNIIIVGAWADDVGANTDQGSVALFLQPGFALPNLSVSPVASDY